MFKFTKKQKENQGQTKVIDLQQAMGRIHALRCKQFVDLYNSVSDKLNAQSLELVEDWAMVYPPKYAHMTISLNRLVLKDREGNPREELELWLEVKIITSRTTSNVFTYYTLFDANSGHQFLNTMDFRSGAVTLATMLKEGGK